MSNYDIITFISVSSLLSLSYYIANYKVKKPNDMKNKVKQWMQRDLINKMIIWKKANPLIENDFNEFIKLEFPENIRVQHNKIIWIDPRILGPTWKGVFENITSTDPLYIQPPPPGLVS
jgi:hypothetical protein